jgi:hypothetical protein
LSKESSSRVRIDGDDVGFACSGNHDRRKADTTASVNGHPIPGSDTALNNNTAIGGGDPASQQSSSRTVDPPGDPDEVSVGIPQPHVLGEASPCGEPRLELIRTHLFVSVAAQLTSSAACDKRNGHAIADLPRANIASDLDHRSDQLVAGDVG